MYINDYLVIAVAKEHTRELIEEASRHRLAASLRRGRRQLWPDAAQVVSTTQKSTKKDLPSASRLVACEVAATPAAAAQAR